MNLASDATIILEKSPNEVGVGFYILPPPMKPVESLAEYTLRWMRENNLNPTQIQNIARAEAKRRGLEETHKVSDSTVQNIITEQSGNQGVYTLTALAWGLGRPIEEVISVAFGLESAIHNKQFTKSRFARLFEIHNNLTSPDDISFFNRQLDSLERDMRLATKPKK